MIEDTTALAQPRRRSHAERIADLERRFDEQIEAIRNELESRICTQANLIHALHDRVNEIAAQLNNLGLEVGVPMSAATLHRELPPHDLNAIRPDSITVIPAMAVVEDRSPRIRRTMKYLGQKPGQAS